MSLQKEISDWLHGRPNWQQEASLRILSNGQLSVSDIDELAEYSKTTSGQVASAVRVFPGLNLPENDGAALRLCSIGEIEGIDKLAPRKPLDFGSGNLTVVYGKNGSGKSSYTRILKKVCGKSHAVDLRSDVFKPKPSKQCCTVSYELSDRKQSAVWNASDPALDALSSVDIFDSVCGDFYLNGESEVSYQPEILSLFDKLVQACDAVSARLKDEQAKYLSRLPVIPVEYAGTAAAKKYTALKPQQTEEVLRDILLWEDGDQKTLDALEERLKNADPKKLADQKRKRKEQLESLILAVSSAIDKVSAAECARIHNLKLEAKNKRTAALDGVKAVQKVAPVDGLGSETWRALWEAARSYAEQDAYKGADFPNISDSARCVLCQQELSSEAKTRFSSFEEYVKGTLVIAAEQSEQARDDALNELPEPPATKSIETSVEAAGLDQAEWLSKISGVWSSVGAVVEEIKMESPTAVTGIKKEDYLWLNELAELAVGLGDEATQHNEDAKFFDREKANSQLVALSAKKWTASQAEAIKTELTRLKKIEEYDSWIGSANTTAISKQAGVIAKKVITDAYIGRFNDELKDLGASRIQVELKPTRATKGHALHALVLKGVDSNDHSPGVVLSDGEKRAVALAAFLADVTGREGKTPFVFDDPISSFDQDYEEKAIDRLIKLSATRQVIVFTHRLSFLGILESKASPEVICVRHEPWGAGEPGEVPIYGKAPEKALNNLLNSRLASAARTFNEDGSEAYYPLAKAICSDFRIIVERIVEFVFLADVIQRHRRDVMTKGKIRNLLKIQESDCEMIDDLMGRYSCFEHSQSSEAPVDVPEPEELRRDIQSLLDWHKEFQKRTVK